MIVRGSVRVPGDKSVTHRALLLAALAPGRSRIRGALTSLDARSTARVLRQLGAEVSPLRAAAEVTVGGRPRFTAPGAPLDCGNSGTTARLLLGLLAAHPFAATLTGDRSLRRRPMRRVTEPLVEMGARVKCDNGDGLPLTIRGGSLKALRYELPVASAQVKSALLFAGLGGGVEVELREAHGRTRDHTERMLSSFGFTVAERDGWLRFIPDAAELRPFELEVPGDPSSAAFLAGAAVLAEQGELRITGVGINPTRTGFLDVLRRMGADPRIGDQHERAGEPVGDLIIAPAPLRATEVAAHEIPSLVDEIPLLALLASRAEGTTIFRGVGELRVKESDRLALIAENLRAVGGTAEVSGDDLFVTGTEAPPRGRVRTAGDHRIAMAFTVLGTLPGADIQVDDPDCAAVSFPGFLDTLDSIGSPPPPSGAEQGWGTGGDD